MIVKKLVTMFLVCAILLGLGACGSDSAPATAEQQGSDGLVDSIQIDTGDAMIRYMGYEYVPKDFYTFGGDASKTIYLKFEYTNKTDEAKNVQNDFNISAEQDGAGVTFPKSWNGEIDVTELNNFFNGLAVNETIPVYYAVVLNSYNPVIITVSNTTEGDTITQKMEQKIEAPDDVIIPGESVADAKELAGSWINIVNGDSLEIYEGSQNPDTGIISGNTEFKPADKTLRSWSSGGGYKLEGDLFTLGDERYQLVRENDKLYLTGMDSEVTYMRRMDYYKLEDAEVHHMGDTVSTDMVDFTLKGWGHADSVSPNSLGSKVTAFEKEPLVPDNGMIWANIPYDVFNKSNATIEWDSVTTNIRFAVIYQDSYTFDMETYNSWITKGYGGEEHVTWFGRTFGDGTTSISPLVSESFDTWLPVAPVVRDDEGASLHLIVILPASSGTQIFAYDLRASGDQADVGQSGAQNDLYGTWHVTEVKTSSDTNMTVAEMESSNVYAWSDWKLIVSESGDLYFQTNNNSNTAAAEINSGGITAGQNRWDYKDSKLVLSIGDTVIYYEKESDNQSFPELQKKELVELLKGTWEITGSRTGFFTFNDKTAAATINGVIVYKEAVMNVIMDENRINLAETVSGKLMTMHLDYTYENGVLSLVYSGDPLKKQ